MNKQQDELKCLPPFAAPAGQHSADRQVLSQPVAWRLQKESMSYGITSYDRDQVEAYIADGWVLTQELYDKPFVQAPAVDAGPGELLTSIREHTGFCEQLQKLTNQQISKKEARVTRGDICNAVDNYVAGVMGSAAAGRLLDLIWRINDAALKVLPHHPDPGVMRSRYTKSPMAVLDNVEMLAHYFRDELASRCRAQGGGNNSNSAEFDGIKQSSTAPTVEVDEHAAFMEWWQGKGYSGVGIAKMAWQARAALASKPPAREAAERQSDVISIVKEIAKEMMADLEDQFGRPNEDGEEDATRNYLTGKFAAITMMERGILARIEVRGAAPAAGNTAQP